MDNNFPSEVTVMVCGKTILNFTSNVTCVKRSLVLAFQTKFYAYRHLAIETCQSPAIQRERIVGTGLEIFSQPVAGHERLIQIAVWMTEVGMNEAIDDPTATNMRQLGIAVVEDSLLGTARLFERHTEFGHAVEAIIVIDILREPKNAIVIGPVPTGIERRLRLKRIVDEIPEIVGISRFVDLLVGVLSNI